MWMNNYCEFWECHMTYATKRAPRMCAWYVTLLQLNPITALNN